MNKLSLLVLATLVFCGCGKGGDAGPRDSTSPASQSPNSAATAKSGAAPMVGKVDAYLTSLLQQFVKEKGRMPTSFLEFAGAKAESIPRPPEGYAYRIDAATTEVKLVKQ